MRKLLLVPILLGVLFLVGAAPATSSAANCSQIGLAENPHNQAGAVRSRTQVTNCTQVSQIRIKYQNGGNGSDPHTYSGFWDAGPPPGGGVNQYFASYLNGLGNAADVTVTLSPTVTAAQVYLIQWCWYSGTHLIQPHYWWQIKNSVSPFNWGPIHEYQSPNPVAVGC